MKVVLNKKPRNPVLIEGFPGFGMVGAIAAEYLIQNLMTEQIGAVVMEEIPAIMAVHDGKLVDPFSIHYSAKHNLLILHAVIAHPGTEWVLSDAVLQIAADLGVKEIISLEGIGSMAETQNIFYYSTDAAAQQKLEKLRYKKLDDGIILGVTSALLVKRDKLPLICLFAETHSALPDSKAAAKLVEAVDAYLGLKVDTKPLLVMADIFEKKLRTIMEQTQNAQSEREQKQMSYVG